MVVKRIIEDRVDVEVTRPEIGQRADVVFALAWQAVWKGLDIAECGVAAGATALRLAAMVSDANASGLFKKSIDLHLFDVFDKDRLVARNQMAADAVASRHATALSAVQQAVEDHDRFGRAIYHAGLFRDTFAAFGCPLGFVHADADLRDSTEDIIEMVERCVLSGGAVVFDDYGTEWSGVADAINAKLSPNWRTLHVAGSGQLIAVRK